MLSLIELENLFEILNQSESSLEGCLSLFNKHFSSDSFKPSFVLMQLLNDNVPPPPPPLKYFLKLFLVFNKKPKINRFISDE